MPISSKIKYNLSKVFRLFSIIYSYPNTENFNTASNIKINALLGIQKLLFLIHHRPQFSTDLHISLLKQSALIIEGDPFINFQFVLVCNNNI